MNERTATVAAWLQSVLRRLLTAKRALYIESADACILEMEHLACFNAFGLEALIAGRFDPSNTDHVGELGEFT